MSFADSLRADDYKRRMQKAYDDLDVCRTQRDTAQADRDRVEGHNRDLRAVGDQIAAMLRDLVMVDDPILDCPAAAELVSKWRQLL